MRLVSAVIRFVLNSVSVIAILSGLVWPPAVASAYTTESCHAVAALELASVEHMTHVEGTAGSCQPCEQSPKVPHKEKNHPCCNHSLNLAWLAPGLQGDSFQETPHTNAMRGWTYLKAPILDGPFQPPRRAR